MLGKKVFNIFNVMQLLYCTKHTCKVPEIFFLLVWCPAHTACEMSDEKRDWDISEDKSPQGNLKDTYLIIYMSQIFMHKHSNAQTRTRSLFKALQVGWKELLQCCHKDRSGFALPPQGKDISVTCSSVASNPARMTQASIVLPLLFWLQSDCSRSGRWKDGLEEVKKPSDTAASD